MFFPIKNNLKYILKNICNAKKNAQQTFQFINILNIFYISWNFFYNNHLSNDSLAFF
jgi:hypothetical protein